MMTHDVAVNCCNVSNSNICSLGYLYLAQSLGVFFVSWIALIGVVRSMGTLSEDGYLFFEISSSLFVF